jgi:hypothetical protein
VVRLPGHQSFVWSLAFSPDGATLASGSGANTVRLWDTAPLKTRYQARREAAALRPEAERRVEQLWREKNDPAEVVEALRADRAPSEAMRHSALRAVLRRVQPPEAAPGNPHDPPLRHVPSGANAGLPQSKPVPITCQSSWPQPISSVVARDSIPLAREVRTDRIVLFLKKLLRSATPLHGWLTRRSSRRVSDRSALGQAHVAVPGMAALLNTRQWSRSFAPGLGFIAFTFAEQNLAQILPYRY